MYIYIYMRVLYIYIGRIYQANAKARATFLAAPTIGQHSSSAASASGEFGDQKVTKLQVAGSPQSHTTKGPGPWRTTGASDTGAVS